MRKIKISPECNVIKSKYTKKENGRNLFTDFLCVFGLVLAACAIYCAVKGV